MEIKTCRNSNTIGNLVEELKILRPVFEKFGSYSEVVQSWVGDCAPGRRIGC